MRTSSGPSRRLSTFLPSVAILAASLSTGAAAAEHEVRMLNKGEAGIMVF